MRADEKASLGCRADFGLIGWDLSSNVRLYQVQHSRLLTIQFIQATAMPLKNLPTKNMAICTAPACKAAEIMQTTQMI